MWDGGDEGDCWGRKSRTGSAENKRIIESCDKKMAAIKQKRTSLVEKFIWEGDIGKSMIDANGAQVMMIGAPGVYDI